LIKQYSLADASKAYKHHALRRLTTAQSFDT
jgi:hypothetical protein